MHAHTLNNNQPVTSEILLLQQRISEELTQLNSERQEPSSADKSKGNSPLDNADSDGMTLLQSAAKLNQVNAIMVLIDAGANPNKKTKNKITKKPQTAFQYALEFNSLDAVKMLIQLKADTNIILERGFTPIHFAANQGNCALIDILINEGKFNPNKTTNANDKLTPAHLIAMNGHLDAAKNLSKWGMDINAKDKSGKTPLHYALLNGHLEVARTLVEQGAQPISFPGLDLAALYTVFGGIKLNHLLSEAEIEELDDGGDPTDSLSILMFYVTRFFLEEKFAPKAANNILTILRSKYTANSESAEILTEKIQNDQSILIGTGDADHFIVAQLCKGEDNQVTLLLYDKGLLAGEEDPSAKEKHFCVRSLSFTNDPKLIQTVVEILKKAKECNETDAIRLIDSIQNEVGKTYTFLKKPTQKPFKISKCFSANYNLTLCNLFIRELGIREGLLAYKHFSIFFRQSVATDFQKHAPTDKKLKQKIKVATESIIEKKQQSFAIEKNQKGSDEVKVQSAAPTGEKKQNS